MNRRELYQQMRAAGLGTLPPDLNDIGLFRLWGTLLVTLLRLGVRVGLVAGAVFGTLAFVAAGAVDRQVWAVPVDAIRIWVGLTAVLAVLGLHVGIVGAVGHGAWMVMRRRLLHRRYLPAVYAGILSGAVAIALALLAWRRSGVAGSAPLDATLGNAAVMVVIVLGGVWIARAVQMIFGVWRSRGLEPPHAPLPRRVGAAWRATLLLVLLFAVFWDLDADRTPAVPREDHRMAETLTLPPDRHVIVLGIDGLGWEDVRTGIGDGSLENWDTLERTGARGRMYSATGHGPAAFWITVATGADAHQHGARALVSPFLAGASHPLAVAREHVGVHELTDVLLRRCGLSYPMPVSRASVRRWCAWEVVRQAGGESGVIGWWGAWPGAGEAGTLDLPALLQGMLHTNDPLAVDARVGEGLRAVLHRSPRPALTMAYLPGLDLLHRATGGYADPGQLEAHRRFLDALIGEAAAALGPEDLLLVVGDRGERRTDATVFHAPPEEDGGVLLAFGSGIPPATRLSRPRPEDVWPTVAWWLGLPPASDWSGQPWTSLRLGRGTPGAPVDYGQPARAHPVDMVEGALRLRQLRDAGSLE